MAEQVRDNGTFYYQLNILLGVFKCNERIELSTQHQSFEESNRTSVPSILESFLGTEIYSAVQVAKTIVLSSGDSRETESDRCESWKEYQQTFSVCLEGLYTWLFVCVIMLMLGIVIVWFLCKYGKHYSVRETVVKEVSAETLNKDEPTIAKNEQSTDSVVRQLTAPQDEVHKEPNQHIKLVCQNYLGSKHVSVQQPADLSTFLQGTTDTLYAELDKFLIKEDTTSMTTVTTIATPRLSRRPLSRRPRIGSSPNIHAASSSSGSTFLQESSALWEEVQRFSSELGLPEFLYNCHTGTQDKRQLERLAQYHLRVCPISGDNWKISNLIVSYTMSLLHRELQHVTVPSRYRYVKFSATGSCRLGTKVSKPNQFDFCFVLQNTHVMASEAADHAVNESVGPGKLMLLADETTVLSDTSAARLSNCLVNISVDGAQRYCLSSKEFQKSAEEIIDSCLKSIYTRTRSLMDRLPFSVQRSATPDIHLVLDTRSLVGFGLQEIKIRLVPCFYLPVSGTYQAFQLYATPPSKAYELKHQVQTGTGSQRVTTPDRDVMWQIFTGDLNTLYQTNVQMKMDQAGVKSCHIMCLQILKSLFTAGPKNNLLDRGELQSCQLETVINFLLLESSPLQWTDDKLLDRFSDCIYFLRSALTNGRLPNFFVNNPHLLSKMPCLAQFPMLSRGRQENLLADVSIDNLQKCMDYVEVTLKDTGLLTCVKDEYSDDMWEYEFFVFN